MNGKFNVGDKVKFNKTAAAQVGGKAGRINKCLGVERLSLAKLEQGKSVNLGRYKAVNMWEVKLDNSNELYPSPEDWLEKIA